MLPILRELAGRIWPIRRKGMFTSDVWSGNVCVCGFAEANLIGERNIPYPFYGESVFVSRARPPRQGRSFWASTEMRVPPVNLSQPGWMEIWVWEVHRGVNSNINAFLESPILLKKISAQKRNWIPYGFLKGFLRVSKTHHSGLGKFRDFTQSFLGDARVGESLKDTNMEMGPNRANKYLIAEK